MLYIFLNRLKGQKDSMLGRALALDVANLGLASTIYGPLHTDKTFEP